MNRVVRNKYFRDSEPAHSESLSKSKVHPTSRRRIKGAARLFAWVLHRGVWAKNKEAGLLTCFLFLVHLNRLVKKKQLITVFSSGVLQSKELKKRVYRATRSDYATRTFEPTFPTSSWNSGVHIKEKRHLMVSFSFMVHLQGFEPGTH